MDSGFCEGYLALNGLEWTGMVQVGSGVGVHENHCFVIARLKSALFFSISRGEGEEGGYERPPPAKMKELFSSLSEARFLLYGCSYVSRWVISFPPIILS